MNLAAAIIGSATRARATYHTAGLFAILRANSYIAWIIAWVSSKTASKISVNVELMNSAIDFAVSLIPFTTEVAISDI